jgi:hypothetical protein
MQRRDDDPAGGSPAEAGDAPFLEAQPTIPGPKASEEIGKESVDGMKGWDASRDTHSISGGQE